MKKIFALSKNVYTFIALVQIMTIVFVGTALPREAGLLGNMELIYLPQVHAYQVTDSEFNAHFLRLCDLAVAKVKDENSKDPFFIDSYGVRALCAAYDMTGNKKYLDAARSWSEKMVRFREKMIPAGAYYMNYGRKPGESKGDWYVADCSSIAMGVLATAVRCNGEEQKRFLNSVQCFASLVMKNYVRPSGGVTDGLWPEFDGEWWCSSALFGSLSFLLYKNMGDEHYLNVGLGVVDWLNKLDLNNVQQPLPLSRQGPAMPMYVLEAYSAGWPYLSKDSVRKDAALAQILWCLNWIADQQQKPVSQREWQLTASHAQPTGWWGAKYGGLPFHQYIFSSYFPARQDLMIAADREMQQLAKIAFESEHEVTQLESFMLMSYAERLNPGAIYRTIKQKH